MKRLLLIIILLLVTGCSKEINYSIKDTDDIAILQDEIGVYDDVNLFDIVKINNQSIIVLSDNYKLNTNTLGINTYNIEIKRDGKKELVNFELNVVDKIPPLVFSGTSKTVEIGYDKDICNLITYGDNYDGNIKCIIEGEYDINKAGTYNLKYYLSDSSNNTKEVNVTLNVVKKIISDGNAANTIHKDFKTVFNKYKNDNNEIGIDVSKWQGNIDFEKVKNAGASFVMMRIGFEDRTTKKLEIDPYFKQNIINAKNAGLKVGVYLFSIATSEEEAINHADWVIKTLDGETLDLPIAFDWENWSRWNEYKISFHTINETADAFIQRINENGYVGSLYGSKFYLETIWDNKNNYPVWLAHYTDKTSYTGNYQMWQLCNIGRIDGISGDVDIDILYK